MKEYELRVFDNPICSSLPCIHTIKCSKAPSTAVGSGKNNLQREKSAISEALEWDTMFDMEADFIGIYSRNNELMINPSLFGHAIDISGKGIDWVLCKNLKGKERLIHRPTRNTKNFYAYTHTSNGISVHKSLELARNSAFMEIVERSYVTLFWNGKRKAKRLLKPCYFDRYISIIESKGFLVEFFSIGDEFYHVVMSVIYNRSELMVTGFKCSPNIMQSIQGAFYEAIQVLEAFYLGGRDFLHENQKWLLSKKGHQLLRDKINTGSNKVKINPDLDQVFFRDLDLDGLFYTECFVLGLPINYETSKKNNEFWPI
ncbi:YcaO-like family protein [Moraxella sp. Tifton1]|uniref:YcaO-like family protein n=1 Tax=Moraxella oculi TaxID=2940516 RepID=UPI002012CBCF|nr:YcaO-like family protein [Moraxella sp. Tifton1]MCL1624357.1 YcaO-like family protein [Moraxella sp. Tifton1]